MKRYSLRVRAQRALALPAIAAVAAIVVLGALIATYAVTVQLDQQMVQNARLLQLLARHEVAERDQLGDVEAGLPMFPGTLGAARVEYRIWSDRGVLAQTATMPTLSHPMAGGFHMIDTNRGRWRLFVLHGANPETTVELAEPTDTRSRVILALTLSLALPAGLLLLATFVIGRRGIAHALRPLEDLSTAIDRRSASDLAPVEVRELPLEVAPMVEALNRLLQRVADVLAREREFSDNAAHELRNPLAALKARAQIIERQLAHKPELATELGELAKGVDRTARVVDRLLELARVNAPEQAFAPFDVSALTEACIAAQAAAAARKDIDLSAELSPGLIVQGSAFVIELALRNLIENAIKFTPAGGAIAVRLDRTDAGIVFQIRDDGPGIAAGAEDWIFERFRRERQDIGGAGMGLALVRAACIAHGGSVRAVRLEPRGLAIVFTIPAGAASARSAAP
ncbi:MAG: hypothetical protein KGM17_10645 [Sphingomonadales bacterium]|nr:hypothetical protein [Sphingomonadales bacterium]